MNDTELDEMLDQWKAPSPPASLRERVRAGFSASHPEPRVNLWRWIGAIAPWRTALAGSALGLAGFLGIVSLASPQTVTVKSAPYVVESRCAQSVHGGNPFLLHVIDMLSYNENGREITLSEWVPDSMFLTAALHFHAGIGSLMAHLTSGVHSEPGLAERRKTRAGFSTGFNQWYVGSAPELLRKGCANGPVVGRETILGYPTIAVEHRLGEQVKLTTWMAPDLGCFALRIKDERLQEDGSFHVEVEKQALHVTVNH